MTTFSYPSESFPAQPRVTLEAPDGWQPTAAPDSVLAIRHVGDESRFRANIVVSVTRHTVAFDVADAVKAVAAEVGEYAEPEIGEPFEVDISGRPFAALNVAFLHAEAGTIGQVHLFTGIGRQDLVDVVHVTGTVGSIDTEIDYSALQSIIKTLTIDSAA